MLLTAVLAVFVGCLAQPNTTVAQESTGSVQGRVSSAGRNLVNARLTIKDSAREEFTNAAGEYRISSIPVGPVELTVFYTGLEPQTVTVEVGAGAAVEKDFILLLPGQAKDEEGEVMLSEFVVAGRREYDAQAIAINEQRFSANLKNVVSTDAFGDINQGNIGEFLKHVPGVTIEVKDGNTPSGIQVRGFNSNYTNVTVDGGVIASTALANTSQHSRQFVLEQASINNYSRIEVVKVPTPDMPANSLGGSVNFVSRSAFERERSELSYKLYLTGNSEALTFDERPGAGREAERPILPAMDLMYVLPLSRNLGVVASFSHSAQFFAYEQSVPLHRWTPNAAYPGISVEDPVTTEFRWTISGNRPERTSGSIKLDWKPGDAHLLEFTAQASAFKQESTSRTLTLRAGNDPVDWGETFTHGRTYTPGASGSPGGSLGASTQTRHGLTRALGLKYTFAKDAWLAEVGTNISFSNNLVRDYEKGFFGALGTNLVGVSRIDFDDINNDSGSARASVYDAAGNPLDPTDLSNYIMTLGTGQHWESEDEMADLRASVQRSFDAGFGTVAIKGGGAYNDLERRIDLIPMEWTYVGPDGIANNADNTLEPYYDPVYSGLSPGHGQPPQDWGSPWLAFDALEQNPQWFTRSSVQEGNTIRNNAARSPIVRETISAGYLMADAKMFRNRLRLIGGFRYELTENEGWGMRQDNNAVYQRDANGELIRDANNNFVRKPEAGAPNSAEDQRLRYLYRQQYNKRDYDGIFPSVSAVYNITDSLLVRAGYAETIGRPRIVDVVPNLSISANQAYDGSGSSYPGFVSSSNTTLKPWEAKNYDLSLEYYLPGNGVASASVFRKDIANFFGSYQTVVDEQIAADLGLSELEIGYQYSTRINVGDARIDGLELNYNQHLAFLGEWARPFTFMANYTKLDLTGDRAADFTDFIPEAGNLGLQMNFGRFAAYLKWNYRGKQLREDKDDYPGANEYIRPREQIDLNLEYRLTDRIAIFLAGRNVTNETNEWEVSGPDAPSWSWMQSHTWYGAQYSAGVRGTF